jgi:choline dehydrogenase-like flavoprotein
MILSAAGLGTVVDSNFLRKLSLGALLERESPKSDDIGASALLAFAEAIIPGSAATRGADQRTVLRARKLLDTLSPHAEAPFRAATAILDQVARLQTGKPFQALDSDRQDALLAAWEKSSVLRGPLFALSLLLKSAHFDRPQAAHAPRSELRVITREGSRVESGMTTAEDWHESSDIECDVVVVGTGAGGAVVGRELADRGFAVVFVEEGRWQRKEDYLGGLIHAQTTYNRTAVALGTSPFPLMMGKLVGGSTAINGGTCFRTPDFVLDEWCESLGTNDLSPSNMAPRFLHIEQRLMVTEPERRFIGPIADVMDRGAQALGWRSGPIARNAVGCEGEGFCGLGCASGARRSVEVSLLPGALERGALVLSSGRAERVLIENGRAVGILVRGDKGRALRVRGKAVVVAGGSIPTPTLLLRQGIANSSGELGRNLSVHPSVGVGGYFDEMMHPDRYIPQAYMVDEFLAEGIMILAAQPDLNVAHALFPVCGSRFMRAMDSLPHLAMLGVMIRDQSRGRVWADVKGKPLVTYNLVPRDVTLLKQAIRHAGELCLAAGARRLHLGLVGGDPIDTRAQFERFSERRLRASDLALISYHPLGTCKMGRDRRTSVIGLNHEAHDVPGLFVVDGSAVPGPPGVNPQLTIMALAVRAAEQIAERLD